MRVVYIMRGLPGSGKSTRARQLVGPYGLVASTDDWFVGADEVYRYDPEKAGVAHEWNHRRFRAAVAAGVPAIAVDNTNVIVAHYRPYAAFAEAAGYEVRLVPVPTLLSDEELAARTTHGVPVETIRRMRDLFESEVSH